ncbi:hypothetical protein GYH30_039112 [Glycine max]|nr:hypothetical protein GYH30_039112 [Glycine max]
MVVVSHHELYVLLHLFLGGVIATDEDRVIIAAEGNIIVREDLVDIPGFTLPEDLSGNCIVHPDGGFVMKGLEWCWGGWGC